MELDVPALTNIAPEPIVYEEPSKYPGMEVDMTFLADRYEPIEKAIAVANSPILKKARVTGTYADEAGKSITVRLTFSHNERTLTREEVIAVTDGIVDALAKEGVALKA